MHLSQPRGWGQVKDPKLLVWSNDALLLCTIKTTSASLQIIFFFYWDLLDDALWILPVIMGTGQPPSSGPEADIAPGACRTDTVFTHYTRHCVTPSVWESRFFIYSWGRTGSDMSKHRVQGLQRGIWRLYISCTQLWLAGVSTRPCVPREPILMWIVKKQWTKVG